MMPCIGEMFSYFLVRKSPHIYTRDSLIRDVELNNQSKYKWKKNVQGNDLNNP